MREWFTYLDYLISYDIAKHMHGKVCWFFRTLAKSYRKLKRPLLSVSTIPAEDLFHLQSLLEILYIFFCNSAYAEYFFLLIIAPFCKSFFPIHWNASSSYESVPVHKITNHQKFNSHIDSLVQDCSNPSALAMELLQVCTKPWISYLHSFTLVTIEVSTKT